MARTATLKIDKDCHVDQELEREYIQATVTILSKRRIRVVSIKASKTRHGTHYYIEVDPSVDANTANRFQYLVGDDAKRVSLNQARINAGLSEWNKLFEAVGRRLRTVYPFKANRRG